MSHQWTMEDFESIYSRFKSSGLSVMDFVRMNVFVPNVSTSGVPSCCAKAALSR